ncbi:phospholipase D-like domain-containing protein [Alicyclobacillus acidocaldarius]|uniref:phospholipase D n=1 Tax=Alicyclobacillus acidocaldarius subsp. acidocaldarius (strain ATCC 27009 / DSM 446 / BCRC 14685 / JCM 5260 / KCTC 1825 / NBRC 15652 / NCIMB 11725 / NRRL B-14509 / 104-IA) TaxID=521098 RepID=C8WQ33_ALIAD|nr:phospholipase D-like domain-containing protein [Alicyclobacillus acidocaldarius]ACV57137.1 phospholipase D/Transphosphatidylase [Alicyclobacillus acidocaldarius subsp. acidocaldarius DSM 446]
MRVNKGRLRLRLAAAVAPALLFMTACGQANVSPQRATAGASPQGAATGAAPSPANESASIAASASQFTWIGEPGAGSAPWVSAIERARQRVDYNVYLLTDENVANALKQAAARGVAVRLILDSHPYDFPDAVSKELAMFRGSKVQVKTWSPSATSYDHAKYLVVDGRVAIVGSANATYSALDGGANLEDNVEIDGGTLPADLDALFEADWAGRPRPSLPPALIVSPGSSKALADQIRQPGPVMMAEEELYDAPDVMAAMEAKGRQLELLLPSSIDSEEMANARMLAGHGVQVRLLSSPYVHAKLIAGTEAVFVGSENLSANSLDDNREVGIAVTQPLVRAQAQAWFAQYWQKAQPLSSASGTSGGGASTGSGGAYPYLPLGISESEARAKWGPPSSISSTTYHGRPETVWTYPNGARLYFQDGKLVHVSR